MERMLLWVAGVAVGTMAVSAPRASADLNDSANSAFVQQVSMLKVASPNAGHRAMPVTDPSAAALTLVAPVAASPNLPAGQPAGPTFVAHSAFAKSANLPDRDVRPPVAPLPTAAPAGLAMLVLIAIAGYFRRFRKIVA